MGRIIEKTIYKNRNGKIVQIYRKNSNDVNLYISFDINDNVILKDIDYNCVLQSLNI